MGGGVMYDDGYLCCRYRGCRCAPRGLSDYCSLDCAEADAQREREEVMAADTLPAIEAAQ